MKYGRNDPCWCGSGLKYKKCHLHRDEQEPVDKKRIFDQLNSFYNYKVCSAPNSLKHQCSKRIIKAHSISKSSSLKEISKDGHVLTTFKAHIESDKFSKIKPKKIGINKAPTFTGFCSFHDNLLFSEIEDKKFTITNKKCFLIAYRAISRELFVKKQTSSTLDLAKQLDKGESLPFQKKHQELNNHLSLSNDLSTTDLEYIKHIYDTCYESKDYSPIHHLIFTLKTPPKVMTSAALAPTMNFQGDMIQSITNEQKNIPDYLIIN